MAIKLNLFFSFSFFIRHQINLQLESILKCEEASSLLKQSKFEEGVKKKNF
jgi:hypothetical protein